MSRNIAKRIDLNELEAKTLKMKADQCHLSEGEYLRELIMSSQPVEAPPRQFYVQMEKVNRIASTIQRICATAQDKEGIAELKSLYRSKINLERMLPASNSEEKRSAEEQLVQIKASIKKMHKNLRSEKGILRRMGEMDSKEKKLERVRSGLSIGNPYRHNRTRQNVTGQERSNQYG